MLIIQVLDEMFRVLRIVRESKSPPRPHEILQELRDISSMAMEHFDEKVCASLKPKFICEFFHGENLYCDYLKVDSTFSNS